MANLDSDIDTLTSQLQLTSIPQENGVSFVGKGLKLDNAKDAQPIVEEINQHDIVEFLNMEGNSLGVEAAEEISKALEKRKEFKKALWKDMFTSRLKTEIPVALKHLTGSLMLAGAKLEVLDLSDNASGPIGVVGFEEFLRSPSCYSLKELRLNNMGLGVTGAKKLASALLDLYNNSTNAGEPLQLEVFIAGRNRLENHGAIALAQVFQKIGTLKEVSIPQNGIYHIGIKALSEAFNENISLEVINLNDNTVTEKGATALSKVLPKLSCLKSLDLGDCLLRSEGATTIAQSICSLKKLEFLNLSFNEVKGGAGSEIIEIIGPLASTLSSLNMDGNQFGPSLTEELFSRAKELKLPLASLSEDEGDDGNNDGDSYEHEEEEEEDDDEDLDDEEEYQEDTESDQPYNIELGSDLEMKKGQLSPQITTSKNSSVTGNEEILPKFVQGNTSENTSDDITLVTTLLESLCMESPNSMKTVVKSNIDVMESNFNEKFNATFNLSQENKLSSKNHEFPIVSNVSVEDMSSRSEQLKHDQVLVSAMNVNSSDDNAKPTINTENLNLSNSFVPVPEINYEINLKKENHEKNKSTNSLTETSDNSSETKDLISINSENSSYYEIEKEESVKSLNKFTNDLNSISPESNIENKEIENIVTDSTEKSSSTTSFDLNQAKNCIIL